MFVCNIGSGGSRKNIWGAWPLVNWEATTAKQNTIEPISGALLKNLGEYTLKTRRRSASAESARGSRRREAWGSWGGVSPSPAD